MSMQQFEKWLRSDDERDDSLAVMHVLADAPMGDLVSPDPDPVPLASWVAGWN